MRKKSFFEEIKEITNSILRNNSEICETIEKNIMERDKNIFKNKGEVRKYYERCYWSIFKKGMIYWIFIASLAIFIVYMSVWLYRNHKEKVLIQQETNRQEITGTGIEM